MTTTDSQTEAIEGMLALLPMETQALFRLCRDHEVSNKLTPAAMVKALNGVRSLFIHLESQTPAARADACRNPWGDPEEEPLFLATYGSHVELHANYEDALDFLVRHADPDSEKSGTVLEVSVERARELVRDQNVPYCGERNFF